MMVTILEIRASLLRFLQKFQIVIEPLVKFVVAFAVFRCINNAIGHEAHLMSLPAELLLALLGTFTPPVLLVLLGAVVSLVHVYVASPLLAILVALLMVILYCFIARFSGKYGYVVLAVPILFLLKIPYVVPLVLGLIATPMAIIPTACGVIVYRMFTVISSAAELESSTVIEDILALYIDVIDQLVADKQMIMTIAVFSVVIIAMYLIRKLSIEYVFEISIAVGAILCILGFLVADMAFGTEMDITSMVFGTVGSMLIALVFQFFRLALDYTAVERVQFEDDDYYYYVKAVPKINLAVPERSVKKISAKAETAVAAEHREEEEQLSDEERYAMGEELSDEEDEDSFS
ncbi:MAG: hypothetical protein IJW37_08980 [Lachnospiraceae bacterium]|nr:hypothetical protein [Lachnospiraceae bacterium]